MDTTQFDALARLLSAGVRRRDVLTALTTVPVVGGLVGLLTLEETEAAGRRKRRKKAHKHGKGQRRKHKKTPCKPQPRSETCAGTCGSVTNNCKKLVDGGRVWLNPHHLPGPGQDLRHHP